MAGFIRTLKHQFFNRKCGTSRYVTWHLNSSPQPLLHAVRNPETFFGHLNVPDDVLRQIAKCLWESDEADKSSFCYANENLEEFALVSPQWLRVARPYIFRRIIFDCPRTAARFNQLLDTGHLRLHSWIKELMLLNRNVTGSYDRGVPCWLDTFQIPFPQGFVALETAYISVPELSIVATSTWLESSGLSSLPNLHTLVLSVTIEFTIAQLCKIVSRLPRLRRLYVGSVTFVEGNGIKPEHDIDLKVSTLSKLELLCMDMARFDTKYVHPLADFVRWAITSDTARRPATVSLVNLDWLKDDLRNKIKLVNQFTTGEEDISVSFNTRLPRNLIEKQNKDRSRIQNYTLDGRNVVSMRFVLTEAHPVTILSKIAHQDHVTTVCLTIYPFNPLKKLAKLSKNLSSLPRLKEVVIFFFPFRTLAVEEIEKRFWTCRNKGVSVRIETQLDIRHAERISFVDEFDDSFYKQYENLIQN